MRNLRNMVVTLFTLSCWGTVHAGQLVVIASNTPTLKPGVMIDGANSITLSDGATVTLISADGKTVKLKGPYQGKPDPSPASTNSGLLTSLAGVVTGPPESDPSLAVFRAARDSARRDVWSIDVGRSDIYCVRSDKPATLWRANARRKAVLTLKEPSAALRAISKNWPQGEQTIQWPQELPLADGVAYLARIEGGDNWVRLQLVVIPKDLPTEAHHAAWMADNGCARQARLLIDRIARGDG